MSQTKTVSLMGSFVVIPWDLFMTFGFTFSFRAHESFWAWAFVWLAFLLNVPAVIISFFFPRLGTYWVLVNTALSMALGIGYEMNSYIGSRHAAEPPAMGFGGALATMFTTAVFLWGPPLVFAAGMLIVLKTAHLQQVSSST
ncbi:MAG: hypothetical protein ACXV7C_11980 [Candidatus Angelobacter sp.]